MFRDFRTSLNLAFPSMAKLAHPSPNLAASFAPSVPNEPPGPPSPLTSNADLEVRSVLSTALSSRMSSVSTSALVFQPHSEVVFSRERSPFGDFIVLSPHDGRARIHSKRNSANAHKMKMDVFSKVLNDSQIVPFASAPRGDVYFFTKDDISESSKDIIQLQRLGPLVNLTIHDSQTDNTKIMDVRIHLGNTVINIRYGTEPDSERSRLLRHALKSVTRRAWARELEAPSRQWTNEEKQQLIAQGFVEGVDVEYKVDVEEYPELANDLDNVRFVRNSSH